MKAKRISQKAVNIGNFDTGKRTNLKRAVSECVYTSRLYYNKDLQSDNEKIVNLKPTVNKKPKPIANKFTTWFLTTIQPTRAAPCQL